MSERFIDPADNPQALRTLLCRHHLAQRAERIDTLALTGGVSSTILRVHCGARTYCVKQALPQLKVQKDWFAPVARVFAEVAWLELAATIVPGHVPQILACDREFGAFVMAYLPPADYRNWKVELLAGHCALEVGYALGNLLGKIHRATAGNRELAARFANDNAFYALRLEPYLVESARQHPELAQVLERLVLATQTHAHALVHGDVSPKNILVGTAGPLLLDAECAWYGDPAFDLAFLLNHLLLKAIHLNDAQPLRALFREVVRGYLPYVTWEAVAAFEARTAALLPGLLLARVDGKSPVEYLSDSARGVVRSRARSWLRAPVATLEALLA